jgi:hypothetical protein
VQVILILFQTYTAIHSGKFMDTSFGGQVHSQPPTCFAKPARGEADLLQAVPDGLGAVMQMFSARLRNAIDLIRDFVNEHLRLARVRQVESRLARDGF